jgi:hypothetical protein
VGIRTLAVVLKPLAAFLMAFGQTWAEIHINSPAFQAAGRAAERRPTGWIYWLIVAEGV